MVNVGRFFCVAIPFILAIGAVISMLVAGLAGVTGKSLYLFQVNTTDLSISPASLTSLLGRAADGLEKRGKYGFHDRRLLTKDEAAKTSNITAEDLGLMDLYDVSLWGWCTTANNGTRTCSKPEYDWAGKTLNASITSLETVGESAGYTVVMPDDIVDAVGVFSTIARWTQIVYIIAMIALAVELFMGIFANCSRIFSCITVLVAMVATVAVCAFAALCTALSVIVVGAVEGTAKFYGVEGDINTKFLAAVWIAAAFAIGSGFFWLFTMCCCAPDHSSRRSSRKSGNDAAAEKFLPRTGTAYQPINEEAAYQGAYANRHSNPQFGYAPQQHAPRRDLAYEPYSHANV